VRDISVFIVLYCIVLYEFCTSTFYTLYDLTLCKHSKYKFMLIFTDNRFQMFLLGQKVSVDLK